MRMDPDHVSVGDPQSGPYVLIVVLRGCDHATGVCAGVDGDIHCVPDSG